MIRSRWGSWFQAGSQPTLSESLRPDWRRSWISSWRRSSFIREVGTQIVSEASTTPRALRIGTATL